MSCANLSTGAAMKYPVLILRCGLSLLCTIPTGISKARASGVCCLFIIVLLWAGAAPCPAQIGVTYDSLLWQPDGSTGLYSDPNHWHLSDDPQVQRTDTTPRPTDVINIHYGTIVFDSSPPNTSLRTFPISGETPRLQL